MHAQAATLHEQSLSLGRQAGDTWTIASALMNAADLARVMREFERAIALLKESLGHYQTLRAAWGICIILDMMAVIAAECGQSERAARLFGAEQALRDTIGSTKNIAWRAEHERSLASVRSVLGEEAFAALWAEGHVMTREQVIAYALEDPAPA